MGAGPFLRLDRSDARTETVLWFRRRRRASKDSRVAFIALGMPAGRGHTSARGEGVPPLLFSCGTRRGLRRRGQDDLATQGRDALATGTCIVFPHEQMAASARPGTSQIARGSPANPDAGPPLAADGQPTLGVRPALPRRYPQSAKRTPRVRLDHGACARTVMHPPPIDVALSSGHTNTEKGGCILGIDHSCISVTLWMLRTRALR